MRAQHLVVQPILPETFSDPRITQQEREQLGRVYYEHELQVNFSRFARLQPYIREIKRSLLK